MLDIYKIYTYNFPMPCFHCGTKFRYEDIVYNEYVCYICGNPEKARNKSGEIKRLAIDHDHKTGKVRKLLCTRCNQGLGHYEKFKDKAEEYLNKLKGE